MKPVWIVDDDKSIRWVLEKTLAREQLPYRSFASASEALALIERGAQAPQVLISDVRMPGESGLDLLRQLPSGLAVVMLSVHDSPALIEQALQTGAKGFLSKRCSPDELIAAVRTAAQGGCYLTPDIAQKLASSSRDPLTNREREIAQLLAQGLEVKAIAEQLGLSHGTVRNYLSEAIGKLGVANRIEAYRLARQRGWL